MNAQHVSQSKHPSGAMGWFHVVGSDQLTFCEHTREPYHTEHISKSKHPNGAMDEVSGKGQKASTHGGSVGVDLAAGERDCAAGDGDATS